MKYLTLEGSNRQFWLYLFRSKYVTRFLISNDYKVGEWILKMFFMQLE